ncbi:MAG: alpha/beta hydrolase [Myxococcales bacterium]|nr:alpha/beta hydrolase [Myxococcales bacterium]
MTLLIILAVIVVALVLWVTGSRVAYHLDDRPRLLRVPTADGWSLSLWFRAPSQQRFAQPVVLCHGLGNNHAFFEFRGRSHLARVLADAGFQVFTMDCRGAGRTVAPEPAFADVTIDDHVDFDVPAVLEAVREVTGQSQVLWVGHSLGGVIGLLASARKAQGRLAALVTIGSPLFFRQSAFFPRALMLAQALSPAGQFPARVLSTLFAPFAGLFPPPRVARVTARVSNIDGLEQRYLLANVFADLWRGVLSQLQRWIVTGRFTSSVTGEDLRTPALGITDVPTLVVGGSVDHLAPLDVTQQFFTELQARDKELVLVGEAFGHEVDYGHGDLIVGRDADRDVYPPIVRFLERHARPLEPASFSDGRVHDVATASPSR